MSVGQSIRQGAKWLLGGNVAGQVLQFAFGVVLARLLVPADFGTLVTVQIFTGLAGFVSGGGMGQALVRAKEAKSEDFQVVFTNQLAVGALIYATFYLLAPWFGRWYHEPLYTDLFRVSALTFLIRPFTNVPNAWLVRQMLFRERIVVDLACGAAGSALAVALAWTGFGVWSLVIGGMSGSLLSIVPLTMITGVRPALRFDTDLTRRVAAYGFKVALNDLASYVRAQTPNFVLGRLTGPAVVGLFNKADSLAKTPRMIAGSIYDPVFRGLAKAQDNSSQSQYLYFRSVTLLSVYMTPLFIGLAWLAEPFVTVVYGDKWVESAQPLSILCIVGILACIGYPSGAVLAARNWLGREVLVHLTQAALYILACLIGIRWGLSGIALGVAISDVISVFYIAFLVSQCLRSNLIYLAKSLVPAALLNGLLIAALAVVDWLVGPAFRYAQPLSYMLLMSLSGGLVYTLAFLFVPIAALSNEAARWKKTLGFQLA